MSIFTDNSGNQWQVEITTTTLREVRKDTGFAFGTCLNDDMKPLNDMLNDFETLPYVLYSILKDAIKDAGLTQETFVNNVSGDALESAQRAIWDAFAFFCPPRERRMLQSIQEATDKLTEEQLASAEKMLSAYIEKQSNSEPLSESSPDHILSAN